VEAGILVPSTGSPWRSAAVVVKKKNGSLRICGDFRRLNSRTIKDTYPLPYPDEVADRIGDAKFFSTFDLFQGYYQVAVRRRDREKTAFCPGPGMGLFEFARMPFGLCNAPATFQRLMDRVLAGLPFVMVYVDDVLIFSRDIDEHVAHLEAVLGRIAAAGLTLRGEKCSVCREEVKYLGHVFSGEGVRPDPDKLRAIAEWPRPRCAKDILRFLGLAGYYRRFIRDFAKIATPLHVLTRKGVDWEWSSVREDAFRQLQSSLQSAPLLAAPKLDAPFVVCTDASNAGLGAVLEQDGRVVCMASRCLKPHEFNYSTIEKECLAVIFAVKQFRHYLLGGHFLLRTDHQPLQWLKSQNPTNRVGRWSLLLQDYDYDVEYRSGSLNGAADGLSRRGEGEREEGSGEAEARNGERSAGGDAVAAATSAAPLTSHTRRVCAVEIVPELSVEELHECQAEDEVVGVAANLWRRRAEARERRELREAAGGRGRGEEEEGEEESEGEESAELAFGPAWRRFPLSRLYQLRSQLKLEQGVLCRETEQEGGRKRLVPLIPRSLVRRVLEVCHDSGSGGHLGREKTQEKAASMGYWVGMCADVERWCRDCVTCQVAESERAPRPLLTSHVVGKPWDTLAMDFLEVPPSIDGNRYLLVIQDYFTKWPEVVAVGDQRAETVVAALKEVFGRMGVPRCVHSDQGANFESEVVRQLCESLGVKRTRTTPYHPRGDGLVERFNRTLLKILRGLIRGRPSEWEECLPLALLAYRTAKHASAGLSPFEMMFGRDAKVPLLPDLADEGALSGEEHVDHLRVKLAEIREMVEAKLVEAAARQKEAYDESAYERHFAVGERVLVRNERGGKLDPKWLTGFEVVEFRSPSLLRVRHEESGRLSWVNAERVKAMRGPRGSDEGEDDGDEGEGEGGGDPGDTEFDEDADDGVDFTRDASGSPPRDSLQSLGLRRRRL